MEAETSKYHLGGGDLIGGGCAAADLETEWENVT